MILSLILIITSLSSLQNEDHCNEFEEAYWNCSKGIDRDISNCSLLTKELWNLLCRN